MKKAMLRRGTLLVLLILSSSDLCLADDFIHVHDGGFEFKGQPLHYMGSNFWYGMNLGSLGPSGDRPRLLRELDRFKAQGITNLRIIAGTEGPDTEPWRIVPALQERPGIYDPALLNGLDFLLDEMSKRSLHAVIMLTNFWFWSGGMTQYLNWAGEGPVPYPIPSNDYQTYRAYASQFYKNRKAQNYLDTFIKFIVTRTNTISGKQYINDPTIMSWELANEPSVVGEVTDFGKWIDRESTYVKSLDQNHLVTTGSEGKPPRSQLDVARDHQYKNIDYVTIHLWAQNWGWYDPTQAQTSYPNALHEMKNYFQTMVSEAKPLNKPLVLEEFGLARDEQSYLRGSPTTYRDQYYRSVFEEVRNAINNGSRVSGVNFWAWGGESGNSSIVWWKPGDPFTGEPPAEPQGWYSIFHTDTSTINIITEFARELNNL